MPYVDHFIIQNTLDIAWIVTLPKSHHQEFYIFWVGDSHKPSFARGNNPKNTFTSAENQFFLDKVNLAPSQPEPWPLGYRSHENPRGPMPPLPRNKTLIDGFLTRCPLIRPYSGVPLDSHEWGLMVIQTSGNAILGSGHHCPPKTGHGEEGTWDFRNIIWTKLQQWL